MKENNICGRIIRTPQHDLLRGNTVLLRCQRLELSVLVSVGRFLVLRCWSCSQHCYHTSTHARVYPNILNPYPSFKDIRFINRCIFSFSFNYDRDVCTIIVITINLFSVLCRNGNNIITIQQRKGYLRSRW